MLQHAKGLEQGGYQCDLYIEGTGDEKQAVELVHRMFGYVFSSLHYGWDRITPADAVVATIWYSAVIVRDLPFACRKIYFVQDYEAWFNPMGDTYLMAENSYRCGLTPITIGRWLSYELHRRFDLDAFHYDFGADSSIYKPAPDTQREFAICFLYQPEKPRRCARIGIDALGIVKSIMPEVKIYFFGSNERGHVWFNHQNLGLLGLRECNDLYNRCAIGLCLSSSNPSRVPFEMMAAGLPVVELWRENSLYDFPPEAVSLSEPNSESLAEAILRLLNDAKSREAMGKAGSRYMSERSLSREISQFSEAVDRVLKGLAPVADSVQGTLYDRAPVKAGEHLRPLPADVGRMINRPPNAYVNSIHPVLRRLITFGARFARRMLEAR